MRCMALWNISSLIEALFVRYWSDVIVESSANMVNATVREGVLPEFLKCAVV
jgi:hypothetical protein